MDVEAFLDEACIVAHLEHPHIVHVLDFGLQGSMPYLVMEYASNGSLRQCYPLGTQLTPKTVLKYVGQIAEAVQYIHDSGFIHRDIKPENLLLDAHNKLLLGDFGITIAAHQVADGECIGAGTIDYMAPEQINGDPCEASDQYALGIVVYEWLCGATPFQGSVNEIARQHFEEPPPSLCTRVPVVPLAAERVIFKALAKDPRDRFESVQVFAEALRNAFAFEPRPILLRGNGHQSCTALAHDPVPANSKPEREKSRGKKCMKRNIWKEITTCFTIDLLAGMALGCGLYALHMAPSLLELLCSLVYGAVPTRLRAYKGQSPALHADLWHCCGGGCDRDTFPGGEHVSHCRHRFPAAQFADDLYSQRQQIIRRKSNPGWAQICVRSGLLFLLIIRSFPYVPV